MSRPRRPFGSQQPGRLPATMIKVLAAEMSDPGRLTRGKRYHTEEAVVDITIGRGVATAEVQGSRAEPYVVTIETEPGAEVPNRSAVWVGCTCPDDTRTGRDACKHAVAALLTLASEIAIEPDLLERWRSGRAGRATGDAEVYDFASGRRIEAVTDDQPDDEADEDDDDEDDDGDGDQSFIARPKESDQISPMLAAPKGARPPTFVNPDPLEHPLVADDLLDDVLDDALRNLRIRWD